jgi:hypothetical protein
MDSMQAQPIFYETLKPQSEMTASKKMICRLGSLLAKRTKPAVRPSSFLKAGGRPQPITQCEPSEKFDLRRRPSFPNYCVHVRGNGSQELHAICGGRRILAILSKFPSDVVFKVLIKLDVTKQ